MDEFASSQLALDGEAIPETYHVPTVERRRCKSGAQN